MIRLKTLSYPKKRGANCRTNCLIFKKMGKENFKGKEHKFNRKDRIKGGKAKSKKKAYANQVKAMAQSKCKNCHEQLKISCPWYETNIKKRGENAKCIIPETKKKILHISSDPNRLNSIAVGKLVLMDMYADVRDIKSQFFIFRSLMEFKRACYPEKKKLEVSGAIEFDPELKKIFDSEAYKLIKDDPKKLKQFKEELKRKFNGSTKKSTR